MTRAGKTLSAHMLTGSYELIETASVVPRGPGVISKVGGKFNFSWTPAAPPPPRR